MWYFETINLYFGFSIISIVYVNDNFENRKR